ncbi:MAG TPA: DUF1800 domain-containing protein [Burkholderiaceae bacterium]|nr:DUF1800 domain-containing protein [Burkholderiaceae bacterium]
MPVRFTVRAAAAALLVALAACGGGGGSSDDTSPTASPAAAGPSNAPLAASRFLVQASYGPTGAEITRLASMSYAAWIDEQFAKPQTYHRLTLNQAAADLSASGGSIGPTNFYDSYWAQAIAGDDQLRQRAAFALSQVFVISFANDTLRNQPRGVASYYDMLGENAFGNFRDLLEAVALHPMMGVYLSHLKNQKENPETGRVPDLNFAREITQLFTIGQYQLNADGTVMTGSDGKAATAYTSADLSGLSQVFTGWSWYAGTDTTMRTSTRFFGGNADLERDWRPMQDYNRFAANTDFHSISAKAFLGVTIPAQTLTTADTKGDLKIALDTLFNHPNVGPFIGKQLIQRLVTSNPSPQYVGRVAAAFNDNGSGKRGDMKAVWKAILLDAEARTTSTSTSYGKVREPVIRLAHFLRAFNAVSKTGRFSGIGNTDDPATRLNQTVMTSPTVFNFYRPGYVPSSKAIADAGLVAPELQIVHDVSVAGYMNYMRSWVTVDTNRDIQQSYSAELALADKPDQLVERMNLLLFGGALSDALRAQLVAAVTSRTIPAPVYPTPAGASAPDSSQTPTNQATIDSAKRDRVYLAVFMSLASPDYLIQK